MKTYKYNSTDNRTVFSPVSLRYAMTLDHTVDLTKLSNEDAQNVSIIANDYLAEIFEAAEVKDITSWDKDYSFPANQSWYLHNYCVMVGNNIHIRNGKNYQSLTAFMENASYEELKYVLSQVSMQAALCRAELLQQNAADVVAG